jgi:hypothetical protein
VGHPCSWCGCTLVFRRSCRATRTGTKWTPERPASTVGAHRGRNHVLIESDDPKVARRLLQQILLRVVLAAPPGSVRVNLTDPVGGGKNLALLLHLPAVLRNEKIATRPDEIEKLLDSLVTHIETVVQTRLLNTYATIEDYNADQPEMTVPYQFLALPDMPTGFTERAWERLRFIAENGIAAGVYVIGSLSEEARAERDQWAETTAGWTTLTIDREDRLEWRDVVFGALTARLDDPPSAGQVNGWCRALGHALERAETQISFHGLLFSRRSVGRAMQLMNCACLLEWTVKATIATNARSGHAGRLQRGQHRRKRVRGVA